MNRYYYDFHVHSCLSPCGDDDNTPNNIAGMATLCGLNIIALTDHNSCKNCPAFFEAAKKYVMDDPMFEGRICSGTPMMYALKELQIPEVDLYRDHTHLSDYGSLLVGYSWYTQFTGNPVTQINLDVIPRNLRIEQHQYLGDLQITEEMKQAIIQTAQYTLENPWTVPGQ